MISLTDNMKKFLLYQVLVIMLVLLAYFTGLGLLFAVLLIILTATLLPVEKIDNMVLLFIIVYFGTLLGIITTSLLIAFWR